MTLYHCIGLKEIKYIIMPKITTLDEDSMQDRNNLELDSIDKAIHHYLSLVGKIRHLPLRAVLETHLIRLRKQLQKDETNSTIKSIHFPMLFLPKADVLSKQDILLLIKSILELSNTKILIIPEENFISPSSSISKTSSSFACLIPTLVLQQLTIDFSDKENSIGLAKIFKAIFNTIRLSSIPSLTLQNLIKNIEATTNFKLDTFFAEITTLPITSLSLIKSNLDTWSDNEWNQFLQAIRLSRTIKQVNVSDNNLSEERLEQLNTLLQQKNSLMTLAAASIASTSHMRLFQGANLPEILPEPCLDRIEQERIILSTLSAPAIRKKSN